MFDVVLILA